MEFINARDLPMSGPMAENHGIIVLQDGKLRYMSLAEFQNYMASASIETDPTLSVGGVAADAAATGAAIKNARPSNLLDNSDFANPVNTQGADSYSGDVYNIDKWKGNATTKSIELVTGGLKITPETGQHGYLRQFLDPKQLAGKKFTAAVCMDDGTLLVTTGVYPAEEPSGETVLTSAETATVLLAVTAGGGKSSFQIRMNSGAVGVAKWAALYEGEYTAENLPTYQPRGYSLEAAVCGAAGGGLSMELVWQNSSPTSEFTARTVSLDLSGYDFVIIETTHGTGFFRIGAAIQMFAMVDSKMVRRIFSANKTGIEVTNATNQSNVTVNNVAIPSRIYGVKGAS